MMHKSLKLALVGLLVASSASAISEWRSPWITERGPLRYTFEKFNKEGSNLELWWAGHYKAADKAFLKHSTKNHPLTALMFNKADFTMKEIFPDCKVPMDVQDYNPILRFAKFSPRANYSEYGFTFGGKWDYAVWDHKGRIGLRASVPFRNITMERDDIIDPNAEPFKDYKGAALINVTRNSPSLNVGQATTLLAGVGAAGNVNATIDAAATAVKVQAVAAQTQEHVVGGLAIADDFVTAVNDAALRLGNGASAGSQDATLTGAAITAVRAAHPITAITQSAVADAVNTADMTVAQALGVALSGPATRDIALTNDANANHGVMTVLADGNAQAAVTAAADRGDRSNKESNGVICDFYRVDLVQALPDVNNKSVITINATDAEFQVYANNDIAAQNVQKNRAMVGITQGVTPADVKIDGYPAFMPANATGVNTGAVGVAVSDIVQMPADFSGDITGQVGYVTNSAGNGYYSGLIDANDQFATEAIEDTMAQRWLTFRRAADSGDAECFSKDLTSAGPGKGKTIRDSIENSLKAYTENQWQFLARHGYELETYIRRGLGDVDLDLFYEHTFNPEWMTELFVGVRAPTGGSTNKYGTAYRPMLGNGSHWEAKLGGSAAYQPYKFMNVKLDLYYSFVIQATEHRMAAFAGAHVKNMGPRADADVDWGYFVGRLDFNFFHPKTSDIRSTFGYEFYYKTEDHVSYKQGTMTPWYGDKKSGLSAAAPLSNQVAQAHTEAISHKIRLEASYQVMKNLEIFSAMSTVFAGQNVMQDRDCNIGFNVRF